MGARIVLAGATGLVGGSLVRELGDRDLVAIGRRAVQGLSEQRVGPVDQWPVLVADLKPAIAISTLGTTIRKAGSKDAFAAIDHDAVVAFAQAAKEAGARQFIMVSSVGANAKASNFYLSVKGRAEDSVRALDFERLDIIRPGLLLGERTDDSRLGEQVMIMLSPLTNALTPRAFDRYQAIAAATVARAIAALVDAPEKGSFVHHNREMLALGGNRA